jgi:hypothetical protein
MAGAVRAARDDSGDQHGEKEPTGHQACESDGVLEARLWKLEQIHRQGIPGPKEQDAPGHEDGNREKGSFRYVMGPASIVLIHPLLLSGYRSAF